MDMAEFYSLFSPCANAQTNGCQQDHWFVPPQDGGAPQTSEILMVEVNITKDWTALLTENYATLQRLMSKVDYPYLFVPGVPVKQSMTLCAYDETDDTWFERAGGFNFDLFTRHSAMATYVISTILSIITNTHAESTIGNSMQCDITGNYTVKPGQFYPCKLKIDGNAVEGFVPSDFFLMFSIAKDLRIEREAACFSPDTSVCGKAEEVFQDKLHEIFSALDNFNFTAQDTNRAGFHQVISVNNLARVASVSSKILTSLFAFIGEIVPIPSERRTCLHGIEICNRGGDNSGAAHTNASTDEDEEIVAEGLFQMTIETTTTDLNNLPVLFIAQRILYKCSEVPLRADIITECLPFDPTTKPDQIELGGLRQELTTEKTKKKTAKKKKKQQPKGKKRKRVTKKTNLTNKAKRVKRKTLTDEEAQEKHDEEMKALDATGEAMVARMRAFVDELRTYLP
jgi:hypothetical protein